MLVDMLFARLPHFTGEHFAILRTLYSYIRRHASAIDIFGALDSPATQKAPRALLRAPGHHYLAIAALFDINCWKIIATI